MKCRSAKRATRLAQLAAAVVCLGVSDICAAAEVYYVASDAVNERLCPATKCPSTNKIYRQQKVEVFEIVGEWARVTEYYDATAERAEFPQVTDETVARWVILKALSKTRPADLEVKSLELDPRVRGIPKAGEFGMSAEESELMSKYANRLVRAGQCSGIEYADKSMNRANEYFVQCTGETRNRYFTAEDVK